MLKISNSKFLVAFYLFLFLGAAVSTVLAIQVLKIGAKGDLVTEVQQYLYDLDYLKQAPTGYYGKLTASAVWAFQVEHGLKGDGMVGEKTLITLKQAVAQKSKSLNPTGLSRGDGEPAEPVIAASRSRMGIQTVPWSIVDQLWRRGEVVRITDLATGRSFQAKRYAGHFHADTEPFTRQDTEILRGIYGGHWSWERRAVMVQIRSQFIAASINGMPHGTQSIRSNDFNGHFCVHFLGSRIHKTGRIDQDHQAMVARAAATELPKELRVDQESQIGNGLTERN